MILTYVRVKADTNLFVCFQKLYIALYTRRQFTISVANIALPTPYLRYVFKCSMTPCGGRIKPWVVIGKSLNETGSESKQKYLERALTEQKQDTFTGGR